MLKSRPAGIAFTNGHAKLVRCSIEGVIDNMFRLLGFLVVFFSVGPALAQENPPSNAVCEFITTSEYLSQTTPLVEECSDNQEFYQYGFPHVDCDQFDLPALCIYDVVEMKALVIQLLQEEIKPDILKKISISADQLRASSDALCRAEQEAYESAPMWNMENSAYTYALCLDRSQDLLLSVFYTAHWSSM